jgi:hypothetical protein
LFPADANPKLASSSQTEYLSWRVGDMKNKYLCLAVAAVVVFSIGFSVVRRVSPTFLAHPLLTIQAMHSYPINARVRLAENVGSTMREYFARRGMGREDIVTIEKYVVVTDSEGGSRLNLDLRQGSIFLHAVDPSFFEPLPLANQTAEQHTAHK